jgi:membrane protein
MKKYQYNSLRVLALNQVKGLSLNLKKNFKDISQKILDTIKAVDKRLHGSLSILRETIQRFSEKRGNEAAASLAYYTLFSIFPLLIVLIVVGSFFLKRDIVQQRILEAVTSIIPIAESVITDNILSVMELRGAVSFIAIISLIWSGSNMFNILVLNINRAFHDARKRNFLHTRLIAFLFIVILALLMVLSLTSTAFLELVPSLEIPINGKQLHETVIWRLLARAIPFVIKFLLFWGIYVWIPRTHVDKRPALIGALMAALAWELVTNAFTWFISSGFANFQPVYGSMSAIVALLTWVYLTGMIVILGAHLVSSIQKITSVNGDDEA